jgi:hypothetical protein
MPETKGIEELQERSETFVTRVLPYCGALARPGRGFFSLELVSRAFDALRGPMLSGDFFSAEGERFVNSACIYMALAIREALDERGASVSIEVVDQPIDYGGKVTCKIRPAGADTLIELDLLRDAHEVLLHPPAVFPWLMGQSYRLSALRFPEPEYLYLYPVYFLDSPFLKSGRAASSEFGGSKEHFRSTREQLARHLLVDCGLDPGDSGFAGLASWSVFPAFAPAQEFNLLGLVSLISEKKIVTPERAESYLRALLRSQSAVMRVLGARALMLYRLAPQSTLESQHYEEAMRVADAGDAVSIIAGLRWQLEGDRKEEPAPEGWGASVVASIEELIMQKPPQPWRSNPVFQESGYQELVSHESAGHAESLDRLLVLQRKHPENWFVNTLLASVGMQRGDHGAEQVLRELAAAAPDECTEAHFRLADLLERSHRHTEALAVYADLLDRWPWNLKASQAALRLELSDLLR